MRLPHPSKRSVAIIGAGISGLSCARVLADASVETFVIEKSPGLGGRLATRRLGEQRFDHGAPSLQATSPGFLRLLQQLADEKIVTETAQGWVVPEGMSRIAKELARGLDVRLKQRATALEREQGRWRIRLESGESWLADDVILTAPTPQSLDLVRTASSDVLPETLQALESISYWPAVLGLYRYQAERPRKSYLNGPIEHRLLSTLWVENDKQRSGSLCVTAQLRPELSRERFDEEEASVLQEMAANIEDLLGLDPSQKMEQNYKRWRYSRVEQGLSMPFLLGDEHKTLFVTGDGICGGDVDGAWNAGAALASYWLGEKR